MAARIAVTVWNGRISPLLDVAQHAVLFDLDGDRVIGRRDQSLDETGGREKLAALRRRGVETLLCGAVSQELALHAAALGIHLFPFLAGEAEAVLAAYLSSRLPSDAFTMPGCRQRSRQRRRG